VEPLYSDAGDTIGDNYRCYRSNILERTITDGSDGFSSDRIWNYDTSTDSVVSSDLNLRISVDQLIFKIPVGKSRYRPAEHRQST